MIKISVISLLYQKSVFFFFSSCRYSGTQHIVYMYYNIIVMWCGKHKLQLNIHRVYTYIYMTCNAPCVVGMYLYLWQKKYQFQHITTSQFKWNYRLHTGLKCEVILYLVWNLENRMRGNATANPRHARYVAKVTLWKYEYRL